MDTIVEEDESRAENNEPKPSKQPEVEKAEGWNQDDKQEDKKEQLAWTLRSTTPSSHCSLQS